MRVQVFGRYTYTMETIVQAGRNGTVIQSEPIGVNPKTLESRLVKSSARYVWRSAQAIIRSFALYTPFRFFVLIGFLPFLLGTALLLRWLGLYLLEDEYSSRLPSLLSGIGLMVVAGHIWAVAFLSDLLAANRRLLQELRFAALRSELPDSPVQVPEAHSPQ